MTPEEFNNFANIMNVCHNIIEETDFFKGDKGVWEAIKYRFENLASQLSLYDLQASGWYEIMEMAVNVPRKDFVRQYEIENKDIQYKLNIVKVNDVIFIWKSSFCSDYDPFDRDIVYYIYIQSIKKFMKDISEFSIYEKKAKSSQFMVRSNDHIGVCSDGDIIDCTVLFKYQNKGLLLLHKSRGFCASITFGVLMEDGIWISAEKNDAFVNILNKKDTEDIITNLLSINTL